MNHSIAVFSLRHFGQFFAETIWPVRHFGHLSHNGIKTCRNSAHQPILSDILTVAILRRAWVGHGPPEFCLAPCLTPTFFIISPFKIVWLTYTVGNFRQTIF